jgi:ketosteroid isomerase-like protein
MPEDPKALEAANKALVRAAFDRWSEGIGSPFDLLADDATWLIVGSSPVSRFYRSRQEFFDEVIEPLNARLSDPLVPVVRGLYADGDMVIVYFEAAGVARDGQSYENTYTWYMRIAGDRVVDVTAFFDTIAFTDFWARVPPAPRNQLAG